MLSDALTGGASFDLGGIYAYCTPFVTAYHSAEVRIEDCFAYHREEDSNPRYDRAPGWKIADGSKSQPRTVVNQNTLFTRPDQRTCYKVSYYNLIISIMLIAESRSEKGLMSRGVIENVTGPNCKRLPKKNFLI